MDRANEILPKYLLRSSRRRCLAFTLVEMLVVIVIIGILAGMILMALGPARTKVKVFRMRQEIVQLSLAIENVRTELGGGDYPPDGMNANDTIRFLRRAFPRASWIQGGSNNNVPTITPDNALTFWLGGEWDATNQVFIGFSADPQDPIDFNNYRGKSLANPITSTTGYNPSRKGPYFDFDKTRLLDQVDTSTPAPAVPGAKTIYLQFYPQNDILIPSPANPSVQVVCSPYIYFKAVGAQYYDQRSSSTSTTDSTWGQYGPVLGLGTTATTPIEPFRDSTSTTNPQAWVNPQTFQLLCPGLDGAFNVASKVNSSAAPLYPAGTNYGSTKPGILDDLSNFSRDTMEHDQQ